ncbi:hypothetical protein [Rhodococcus koreensis]|uniref:hypothetical protein n=1 Tax=Rhodococcus koreensis TaxID=99653 RepID=UPI00366E3639
MVGSLKMLWQPDRMTGRGGTGTPRSSAEAEKDMRYPSKHGWRPHDTAWVTWVALLPILLLVVSVPAALIEDNRGTMIGDVLVTWNLFGIFGLVVTVPVTMVALFGAAALKQQFRFGRWLASLGSAAAVIVFAALAYGIVAETVSPDEWRDPNSWAPVLSPSAAVLVLVPYFAITVANTYVIGRLWKRPA